MDIESQTIVCRADELEKLESLLDEGWEIKSRKPTVYLVKLERQWTPFEDYAVSFPCSHCGANTGKITL